MSGSLRYKDPVICEHLASQYVMGVMTPRVRARVERLRQQVPELDDAITAWSDQMAIINESLPEKQPSSQVWKRIENVIATPSVSINDTKDETLSWWESLAFWRWLSVGTSITSFALVVALSVGSSNEPTSPVASYTAVMSPVVNGVNNVEDIRFVVNVYQKTESKPSRLFIQWSERKPRQNAVAMHVWAEDQSTRELTYIGVESRGAKGVSLNKATWAAVANSSKLFFTNDTDKPSAVNTVFEGPCIQLEKWKADSVSI